MDQDKNAIAVVSSPENRGIVSLIGLEAIEVATKYANRLKDIIEKQQLFTMIGNGKHVHVDGWTTLGAMLGVFPEPVSVERIERGNMIEGYLVEMERYNKWTKKTETYEKFVKVAMYSKKTMKIIKDPAGEDIRHVEEIKFRSEVVLYTLSGQKVGRGVALCSNLEEGKLDKPEYAIASMSQTRATGKAFRLPFSWIMTLGGYEPTPFEDAESFSIGGEKQAETETITPGAATTPAAQPAQAEKPAEKTKSKAAKAEAPASIVVPEDPQKQKELWAALVGEAKKVGVSVEIVREEAGFPAKDPKTGEKVTIKISQLPTLIPALAKAVDEMMRKLEQGRGGSSAAAEEELGE